jgi:hypothetical protein
MEVRRSHINLLLRFQWLSTSPVKGEGCSGCVTTQPFETYGKFHARFQVLTAECIKPTGFWDDAPCNLVETDRSFRPSGPSPS